jgi:type VI secretion system protein ImpJ
VIRAKDLPDAVQWHEGLLLAPQHFQLLARRQEDALAYHVLAGMPYCWGVRSLEIDVDLLGAGTLRVSELEAIMPDGMVVSHSQDSPGTVQLELKLDAYAGRFEQGEVMAYLVVAKGGDRFQSIAGELVADEHSGAEPIDVPRMRPNLQLLAGDPPPARFVSFPLAQTTRENGVYKLTNYVPPLVQMSKASALWRRCSALAGRLREKAVFLAKQASAPSSSTEDRLRFLELRDRLRSIVTLLPHFEAVLNTEAIHPYPLYLALCDLCGPLSLLRPGAVPPAPVQYRHTDIHATMETLLVQLDGMLEAVSQTFREVKFRYDKGVFAHELDTAWLGGRLVVGARGRSERDATAWMEAAIIGSNAVLEALREKRILGAQRTRIDRADEFGIASDSGTTLFTILVDPNLVLAGQDLIVFNPTESAAAQRPSELILYVAQ